MRLWSRVVCAGFFVAAFSAGPAWAQETGTITGVVRNASTNEPLASAQVSIQGTGYGTLTQSNGRFVIANVPAGTRTVRVDLIGYATKTAPATIRGGATVAVDFNLQSQAVELSAIVVTGVAGATQKSKLPFEVAQVRASDIKLAESSPLSALEGKVAGATVVQGSGRPGEAPSLLLRGVTSLNAEGRSQDPLYIVDGVILGSSMIDIDALDIESIEVVKGAAAASLYGSRAGSGVVQIRTKRGAARETNTVHYTARSEMGRSGLASIPTMLENSKHPFKLVNGQFQNADGTLCDWLACKSPVLAGQKAAAGAPPDAWNTYMSQSWPGASYDQIARFFQASTYMQNSVAADGRSGATNYHVSGSNMRDPGVMPGMSGFNRTNLRVNVDQNVMPALSLQTSAFYSRSTQGQFPESQGNPMFNLTRMPAGVDLWAKDASGNLVLKADPTNTESPNPLYEMFNRKYTEQHSRFLGSANVRWAPLRVFDIEANGSFDRLDLSQQDLYPKGYRTILTSASLNNGNLYEFRERTEALNASITGTLRWDLAPQVHNVTRLRYLYENTYDNWLDLGGYTFAATDVPTFINIDQKTLSDRSYNQTIRADGYFAITNFDIKDRYVLDGLIRNDGSSLFGADQRRQWYYRAGGAWRVSQEPFFHIPGIQEFKLRYSVGTAGGRPNFAAQYETYTISGGRMTPYTLGNKDLRPERSTEREAGVDIGMINNKVTLSLTNAQNTTTDQILQVPLPAYTGYQYQWRNAGTITSHTWEATLDARLLQRKNLSWSAKFLFDRSKSRITELTVPPFQYGLIETSHQGMGSIFYARPGEEVGTFYGMHYATSCADLPQGTSCDGFKVNDQGFLVWTGSADFTSPQWGTNSTTKIRGSAVKWGTPFAGECTDRSTGQRTLYCPVGKSMPDYSMNLSSNLTVHGVAFYALLSRVKGFSVYNQPLQWSVFKRWSGLMENKGEAAGLEKPLGYYDALYGVSGLLPSNAFVEDASFYKLREASVSYRFSQEQLAKLRLGRLSSLGITFSGRNLKTWTNYRGFDPEVGMSGGVTGSAALARVEGYQYPNFRTWTTAIDINF